MVPRKDRGSEADRADKRRWYERHREDAGFREKSRAASAAWAALHRDEIKAKRRDATAARVTARLVAGLPARVLKVDPPEKVCADCHVSKPIEDFYFCVKPGRRARPKPCCKPCEILRSRARRQTAHGRMKRQQANQRRFRKYPEKRAANLAVFQALKSGRLVRPDRCQLCWDTPAYALHGHHEDYERPLDVVWLCRKCHALTLPANAKGVPPKNPGLQNG